MNVIAKGNPKYAARFPRPPEALRSPMALTRFSGGNHSEVSLTALI